MLFHNYNIEKISRLYGKVIDEVITSEVLPTKYLYLGWHGAKLWLDVYSTIFRSVKKSLTILENHFDDISTIINKDLDNQKLEKNYDIVSLGTGCGEDDLTILKYFSNNQAVNNKFNITAVDLSLDLLKEGAVAIKKAIADFHLLNRVENMSCILIDLENLSCIKSEFDKYDAKRRKLFHLLGLTLGNNNEELIIKSISNSMAIGDYLLLDVDLLPEPRKDREEKINQFLNMYRSNPLCTDKWLCNTLYFMNNLVELDKSSNSGNNLTELKYKLAFSDKEISKVSIEYSKKPESNISSIPSASSLTRYHIYYDSNSFEVGRRRVDYSNKYRKEPLTYFFKTNGFAELKRFTNNRASTSLFLLKKISDIQEKSNHSKPCADIIIKPNFDNTLRATREGGSNE